MTHTHLQLLWSEKGKEIEEDTLRVYINRRQDMNGFTRAPNTIGNTTDLFCFYIKLIIKYNLRFDARILVPYLDMS